LKSASQAGLTAAEFETLAAFRAALRRFLAFSEDAAREAGLAPRQYQALLAVRAGKGGAALTVGDLAESLHLRHHSAVGLVDRLAALGLVSRRRNAPDRRRALLALTARGERRLASLAHAHRRELVRLAPELEDLLARLRHGQRERPRGAPRRR
jgi:DNA-binding MarR family transcriptional regulator